VVFFIQIIHCVEKPLVHLSAKTTICECFIYAQTLFCCV